MTSPISRTWRTECLSALGIVIIGNLAAVGASAGESSTVPLKDVIVALFTVSGGLVALILPAASLVGESLGRQINYSLERLETEDPDERRERAAANLKVLSQSQVMGRHAWNASLYSIAGFVFASVAFFVGQVRIGGYTVFVHHLLVGITTGLVIVGAIRFCVPAYWLYEFRALQAGRIILKYVTAEKKSPGAPVSAPPASTESDAKRSWLAASSWVDHARGQRAAPLPARTAGRV